MSSFGIVSALKESFRTLCPFCSRNDWVVINTDGSTFCGWCKKYPDGTIVEQGMAERLISDEVESDSGRNGRSTGCSGDQQRPNVDGAGDSGNLGATRSHGQLDDERAPEHVASDAAPDGLDVGACGDAEAGASNDGGSADAGTGGTRSRNSSNTEHRSLRTAQSHALPSHVSLRDIFACELMKEHIANNKADRYAAQKCYILADQLLAAREI